MLDLFGTGFTVLAGPVGSWRQAAADAARQLGVPIQISGWLSDVMRLSTVVGITETVLGRRLSPSRFQAS